MSTKNNDQKNVSTKKKSVFQRGLGRTLLLWFLVLSLLPLTVISLASYFNARSSLEDAAAHALKLLAIEKTRYIDNYFSEIVRDQQQHANMKPTIKFLEELQETFQKGYKTAEDFVSSYNWAMVLNEYGGDWKNFQRIYGYYDIFLIDAQGNVLFSLELEDDLGTNLFNGKYADTLFAGACDKALETGQTTFSDFEFYAPSGNQATGFLVSVIVNDDGDKIGLLAFQLAIGQLNTMMMDQTGLGDTAETYLVGADLKMRSDSVLEEESTILTKKVENEQIEEWYREHVSKDGAAHEEGKDVSTYDGPHGERVLGIHNNIDIAGMPFAVLAEIEEAEAFAPASRLRAMMLYLLLATFVLVSVLALPITRRITLPVLNLSGITQLVAKGQLDQEITISARNEIGELAQNFNEMLSGLRRATRENEKQTWIKTGQAELNDQLRGEMEIATLAQDTITYLAKYLNAQVAALYLTDEENKKLQLVGSYAYKKRKNLSNQFEFGEGLVGQAAIEKKSILLTNVPDDYIAVTSGLGEAVPRNILVLPFMHEGKVKGVIELGSLAEFSESDLDFLKEIAESIAIAIHTTQSRQQVDDLLIKTQNQAEELQAQQEELKQANEELEEHTKVLKESEERLQTQQEELKQTNEELEEQTQLLEEQKTTVQQKNLDLESARKSLEEKAEELELSSKYKSEFLANMSHELRTPLNSIQLLSRLMADNKDGNLTEKQVEFSRTINSSGSDLMELINEVLDLSKVEAGKMELQLEDISLQEIARSMERNFKPLAQEKGLTFTTTLAESLPLKVRTDRQRIEQVMRNLLSNSFKFTSEGSITLSIGRCTHQTDLSRSGLDPEKTIALSVSDTGIGIKKEKQKVIFEAFQQSDGTTSRKFGGTGLGLSISRELAKLLGGEIMLESEEGKGSTFTLYLPETLDERRAEPRAESRGYGVEEKKESIHYTPRSKRNVEQGDGPETSEFIPDDRKEISPDDKSLLIVEDDFTFAKTLADLSREKGFKVLVAEDGETGLYLADYYKPSAIVLDYGLPGMNGGAVISKLRDNPHTRHIPVHFISASDKKREVMKMGAVGFLTKPVSVEALGRVYETIEHTISSKVRTLLIVEDDENQRKAIAELIGNGDTKITGVATGKEAYDLLQTKTFDCIIMDLGLPDMSGMELLTKIRQNEDSFHIPVIVYTGRDLTREEETTLNQYAESIIIKGANSLDMLLDKTTLFLHHIVENLPEEQKGARSMTHDKESILQGKKILLVDDDMRNVFAITSTLEEKGMQILVGKNGKEALEYLEKNPDIDLVLMDVMMPEMDGYEASQKIRKQARFKDLPIIALTAKAMKGDRARCIEAGSSDYLAKPVDAEKLLSMMRVWLY
jgi:CheY-like chemotaxis protein/signal transduction histidine kinase/HAMP domain-containing protein